MTASIEKKETEKFDIVQKGNKTYNKSRIEKLLQIGSESSLKQKLKEMTELFRHTFLTKKSKFTEVNETTNNRFLTKKSTLKPKRERIFKERIYWRIVVLILMTCSCPPHQKHSIILKIDFKN